MDQLLSMLANIGFNWHIALANFVNFLIVFTILHFLVFKKVSVTLKHRKHAIEKGLDDAEKSKQLLLSAEEEKAKALRVAHESHMAIIKDAETKANALASEIHSKAVEEMQNELAKLDQEHAEMRARTEKEFNDHAPKIVAQMYEKLLKNTMTESDNNRFISAIAKN
jgi:F0F1-type ATP synthase membrane subunit b/b'